MFKFTFSFYGQKIAGLVILNQKQTLEYEKQ